MKLQLNRKLSRLREAYRHVFNDRNSGELSAAALIVLDDLKSYASYKRQYGVVAFSPQSGLVDPMATMIGLGQRQTFDHIIQMLNLTEHDVHTQIRDEDDYGD